MTDTMLLMPIDKKTAYLGSGNPKWRGNDAKYLARHVRVRTARGKASEHNCAECGNQAREWAHTHDTDPFDVNNYRPMCVRCHRAYDRVLCVRGEQHGRAKITEEDVREIRRRCATGESQRIVGVEFGITQCVVSRIVRRVIWKEVMP